MAEAVPVFEFGKSDIKTAYCIDLDTRDRQVMETLARIPGRLSAHAERPPTDPIAVVCYGPSLEETWPQLKAFKFIITCSGAHKFLIDRGIIPTWHCEVDPRPHKAELIGTPHPDVEYLCASVCHKAVFDLLEGFNVKLWHVFSHEVSREKIAIAWPRGDWAITGGSNIGMRAMVLARFLGFRRLSLFGMDYSFKNDGSQHAGWHPKEFPNIYAVESPPGSGEMYYTNPPMHQYCQQFFHEVQQLGEIELELVGNGLLQAEVNGRLRSGRPLIEKKEKPSMLAATSPPTITPEYAALNRQLHESDPAYGVSGSKRAETVRKLIDTTKPETILDYGCGKGTLGLALSRPIWEYDPCIPGKDAPPRPADLVICTDVLEHIEPEMLGPMLMDLARCTLKVCYVVINTGPAIKHLANGRNAHLIQQPMEWWREQLGQFFSIALMNQEGVEVTACLGPKPKEPKKPKVSAASPPPAAPGATAAPLDFSKRITPARHLGTEVRFYTPNDQTQWRAKSLFTKEAITIEWIESFGRGEMFWDIGANMGGYSVWAAARRGVEVVAFEPEATNYSLLCRNLVLNQVKGVAYCMALSDQTKLSRIYLSTQDAGGSCNSFDEKVGHDLQKRKGKEISQGCIGYSLDEFSRSASDQWPDHIKIDVDGLEHKVIAGAKHLLESGKVKSLLVEVNDALPEHRKMVQGLRFIGYDFDPQQVERSRRTDGPFKGCAEYVFTRRNPKSGDSITEASIDVPAPVTVEPEISVADAKPNWAAAIPNFKPAVVQTEPFPWLYLENVFPQYLYDQILKSLPEQSQYVEIAKSRNLSGYPLRFTADPTTVGEHTTFWQQLFTHRMRDGRLKRSLLEIFKVQEDPFALTDECLLVRDLAGYKIGPHTDSPAKVITVLFYLPAREMADAGTSIYVPKEKGFADNTGRHFEFDSFEKVQTMPFRPNSAFAFLKTGNSFHGVQPCQGTRDVLLYDIRRKR